MELAFLAAQTDYLCPLMKIAVNTRFLLNDYLEGYGYFIYEVLSRLVKDHPEHEFLFIFDRPFDKRFVFSSNVKAIVAGPPARHPILWKWWYDIQIPRLLKKHKADLLLSCDGFCSLTTKIPQCLVVHDLSFIHYPSFIRKSHLLFYKHFTPKFLEKAKSIATVSAFSKKDIITQYKVSEEKITVVYSAAKEIFHPVDFAIQEQTRNKYTAGKNYFVYAGAIHPRKNLMQLLKAFSVFKKRQKSDWKLVLAGRLAWKYEHFKESLKSYKYRDDVVLTGYIEEQELVNIIGSAYAMVYTSLFEGFGVPVVEAMRCRIPVVTSLNSSMQEIAVDAALFANPTDHSDIADKMMLLYKDETLRNRLIQKGIERVKEFSWVKTAELMWQAVMKSYPDSYRG
jgi:glycosyltransferase involved in cell wall biosynthesis